MAGKAELAIADLRVAMGMRSGYRRLTPLQYLLWDPGIPLFGSGRAVASMIC
jgi:hypothetical protein